MSSFNARDLALLLPDEVDATIGLRSKPSQETAVFEPLKPRIDKSKKVTRYFPNKAPVWNEVAEDFAGEETESGAAVFSIDTVGSKGEETDRRLRRLQASDSSARETEGSGRGGAGVRQRKRYEAEVVVELDVSEEPRVMPSITGNTHQSEDALDDAEEEEEESEAMRRARIRSKMLGRQEQSQVEVVAELEESEYETDSDDSEEEEERVMLRPVFVPRAKRETIIEQEQKQAEEELQQEKKLRQAEERKKQTRVMVAESIKRIDEKKELSMTDADSDAGLPDDADDANDEEEFELWRLRELNRLKRDIEHREVLEMERAETIRRRGMTDEERQKEDEMANKDKPVKEKAKWNFLQKYYHKGVFYMDEDSVKREAGDVRAQEFDAPTLEDKVDKSSLPAIMQVKKFGMRGRTKYTHLVDQDTTRFDSRDIRPDARLLDKYQSKVGGVGDLDSAGRKKKQQRLS